MAERKMMNNETGTMMARIGKTFDGMKMDQHLKNVYSYEHYEFYISKWHIFTQKVVIIS